MKFKISKEQLLAQLPQKSGYSLIQELDGMPSFFIFEGLSAEDKESKYPDLMKKFTATERGIFRELETNGKATRKTIHSFCSPQGEGIQIFTNVVDVHIKNIRRKLPRGMKIKTIRGTRQVPGWYELHIV